MLHLSWLLKPLQKFHPEIVSDFVVDYCKLADQSGDETYHYGYGSLKWALSFIAEKDEREVGLIFFNILCEGTAKKIEPYDYQHNILKFRSITRYRLDLKAIDPIDVTKLPSMIIGTTKIVINNTGRQLSSMIFRHVPDVGLVISVGEKSFPSIKTRYTTHINQMLDLLGSEDGGWVILTNPSGATIINHSTIETSVEKIIGIITPALTQKPSV